ncbi:hypothetical protein OH77DRAFT_1474762 [Trametes cingulata]|nr:hypothetical protein OH77DRAFT_1474762 [Trametes cingulata]
MTIPAEILDHIVFWLLRERRAFSSISAFALASHRFRQVAFRRYFAALHVRSAVHWVRTCQIVGTFTWVRSLEASTTFFRYKMDGLSHFTSLRSLELDFSGDGLSTQNSRAGLLFKNMTAALIRLKLTHLPRIDSTLLSLVASRFSSLETLELSCTERLDIQCCWLCFEESSTCVVHSPIPDAYVTAETLARSFCRALTPLSALKSLHLGIFLSDADVLIRHLDRCAAVAIASLRTGYYPAPPFGPSKCAVCRAKHETAVLERERTTAALFKSLLPSLLVVGFSSWFSADRPKDASKGAT